MFLNSVIDYNLKLIKFFTIFNNLYSNILIFNFQELCFFYINLI